MSNLPIRYDARNRQPAQIARRRPAFAMAFPTRRKVLVFETTEFSCGFEGRSFWLENVADRSGFCCSVARNGQNHICGCGRFKTTGRCRHITALISLLESGVLDAQFDPDRPESPFPSPQQLADEAGMELPF